MMSIPKALKIAADAKIQVGPVRKSGTVQSRIVGALLIEWDSSKGGAACWNVLHADGSPVTYVAAYNGVTGKLSGYQGEAIAHAVRNQAS